MVSASRLPVECVTARRGRRHHYLEALPARRLLAVVISGTLGNDVIAVATSAFTLTVTINGSSQSFPISSIDRLDISADAGNDTIELLSTGTVPALVNAGDGDDRFVLGGGDWRANLLADITLQGGVGSDTVSLDNTLASSTSLSVTNPFNVDTQISTDNAGTLFIDVGTPANTIERIELGMGAEADEIQITGLSSLTSLLVQAGGGDDAVLVASDFDSAISGNITLDGGSGADGIIVDDSADSLGDAYLFGQTNSPTFRKDTASTVMTYNGFSSFYLVAGRAGNFPNNQSFRVTGLPQGLDLLIDAGTGDDALVVGSASTDLSTIQSVIRFNGQAGFDRLDLYDPVGATPKAYSVSASKIEVTGQQPVEFSSLQYVHLRGNAGNNLMEALDTIAPTSVTLEGGAGNDTFRIGNGDIDSNLGNGVSVVGGVGNDTLLLDDLLDDEGNDIYTFAAGLMNRAQRGVYWSSSGESLTESVQLLGSPNADTIRITSATTEVKLRLQTGDGNDLIFADSTNNGPNTSAVGVTIVSGAGNDSLRINADSAGADAVIAVDDPYESLLELTISAGGRLNLAGSGDGVLRVTNSLTVNGTLDVNDQTLLLSNGSFNQLTGPLAAGYNSGSWNTAIQPAIISTAAAGSTLADALGLVRADMLGLPTFGIAATMPGDLVVRYTLTADANLDRIVNFDDLLLVAQNYNPALGGRSWNQGNFNYETPDTVAGAVGFDDLLLLAQNYGRSFLPRRLTR